MFQVEVTFLLLSLSVRLSSWQSSLVNYRSTFISKSGLPLSLVILSSIIVNCDSLLCSSKYLFVPSFNLYLYYVVPYFIICGLTSPTNCHHASVV